MLVNFLVSVDSLSGKNVIGTGGTVIGEVKGAEVNTSTWAVTHLQVKLTSAASDLLGFKKRFGSSSVCMPVALISAVGDVVTIGTDINELSRNSQITGCPD
jgi:sporulation protein YlmC with PRC-barrel domain